MSETRATTKTLGQAIDEITHALEGLEASARLVAIKAACEHLGVVLTGSVQTNQPFNDITQTAASTPSSQASQQMDIRSLKQQKSPSNSVEMACIVAYYLQYAAPESGRKSEISSSDLETYFRQADYPIPKRPENVLFEAKAAGYFDSIDRGAYRLNAVGYNLVVHSLPRAERKTKRNSTKAKRTNKRKPGKGPARSQRK